MLSLLHLKFIYQSDSLKRVFSAAAIVSSLAVPCVASSVSNLRLAPKLMQDSPGMGRAANLTDFGARCDGQTIENVALTKAIQSGANIINLPQGVCVIDDFPLPSNITIEGKKDGSSKVKARSAPHVFSVKGTRSKFATHVTIDNLTFFPRLASYTLHDTGIDAAYVAHLFVTNNKASEIELIQVRSNLKYNLITDADMSKDIHISGNTCTSSNKKDQCVDIHDVDGAVVENNKVRGYMHGLMYWGGDANIVKHLTDPRWVKNVTYSRNDISGCSGGGIWGSKGENIKYLNNQISNVGDVALDFEGTVSGYASGNTCHNAKNACASAFFINKVIVFENNTLIQPTATQAIARIYNATQLPENQDIQFRNNTFECQDPSAVCTVDDNMGPASGLTFVGNRFINTSLSLAFNNSADIHVVNNTFDFTHPLTKPAVTVGTFGKNAYVSGNKISAVGGSAAGISAIEAKNVDFNHNSSYFIGANKVTGFTNAIKMNAEGKNVGTTAKFVVCPNAVADASVNKPADESGGGRQKVVVSSGSQSDCSDPGSK